jgi:hypothetical protein
MPPKRSREYIEQYREFKKPRPKQDLTKKELNDLQKKRRAEQRIALRLSLGKNFPSDIIREIEDTMGISEKFAPKEIKIIDPDRLRKTEFMKLQDVEEKDTDYKMTHYTEYPSQDEVIRAIYFPAVELNGKKYRGVRLTDRFENIPNSHTAEIKLPGSNKYTSLTREEVDQLKSSGDYEKLFGNDVDSYSGYDDRGQSKLPITRHLNKLQDMMDYEDFLGYDYYGRPIVREKLGYDDFTDRNFIRRSNIQYHRPISITPSAYENRDMSNVDFHGRRYEYNPDDGVPTVVLPSLHDVQQDVLRQASIVAKESSRQNAIDRFNNSLHVTQHRKPRQLRN